MNVTITDGRWRVPVPERLADIERAALTILARAHAMQPLLGYWVEAIAHNPAYVTSLEDAITHRDFEGSPSWARQVEYAGGVEPHIEQLRSWDEAVEDVERAIEDLTAYPDMERSEQRLRAYRDRVTLRLARAVMIYRLDGRPVGDTTTTLRGLGGPLVAVTSSLAAALAAYAADLDNLWAAIKRGDLDD